MVTRALRIQMMEELTHMTRSNSSNLSLHGNSEDCQDVEHSEKDCVKVSPHHLTHGRAKYHPSLFPTSCFR